MSKKMMWSTLVHLTMNMWGSKGDYMYWDDKSWDKLIDECEKYRINTIVLDLGDGIQYKSHPEISVRGAWSHERVREEIAKCKAKGITIIPKLNFAAAHDNWLGEYHQMLSTSVYYKVCKDLINEVSELFENPEYIHLGMDEEDHGHAEAEDLVIFRQKDLLFHDLRYLVDCVKETGAKPWIWHDNLFYFPEKFKSLFSTDEVIISPWHYYAFKKEHFTPIASSKLYTNYYTKGIFAEMNLEYVEEDPFFLTYHEQMIPNAEYGFKYVPCASLCFNCKCNHDDTLEYFRDNVSKDSILGFMTAPWFALPSEKLDFYIDSLKSLDDARRKFFPED